MTAAQTFSVVLLVAIFALSIWRRVNVGLVALPATLLLTALTPVTVKSALAAFPVDLCVLIVGVTLLFGHAERSGIIDRLISLCGKHIGDRRWAVPWLGFLVGALLTTVGGFPTAIAAALLPMMSRLAAAHRVNYLMTAIITGLGLNSAGFSPLSTSGALIHTVAAKVHVSYPQWTLYAIVVGLHVVLALVTFVVFGGLALRREPAARPAVLASAGGPALPGAHTPAPRPARPDGAATEENDTGAPDPMSRYQWACLGSFLLFVTVTVAFRLDVGLVALTLALALQLFFRPNEKELIARIPWPVVLLVCGLLVYLGALQHLGTLTAVETALSHISSPILALTVLAYLTAVVSNVESSTLVVLGVAAPLALSLGLHYPALLLAIIATIAMSAAAPAINPAHIGGALILASAPAADQQRNFRTLIIWAGMATVIVPGLMTLYTVLTGL